MRTNGDAVLVDHGIRIPASYAKQLGLVGMSTARCKCWGLWLDSKRGRELFYSGLDDDGLEPTEESAGLPTSAEQQFPHLIVSPIHPDAWTSAFRLEAYLDRSYKCRDERENAHRNPIQSIPAFTEALRSLGIDAFSVEGGVAGYGLFIVSAVCELPVIMEDLIELGDRYSARLREKFEELRHVQSSNDRKGLRKEIDTLREEWFRGVGLIMVPLLAAIKANLRLDHQHGFQLVGDDIEASHTRAPYLNFHVVQRGPTPWFLDFSDHFRHRSMGQITTGLSKLPFLGVGGWVELAERLRSAYLNNQPAASAPLHGIAQCSSVEARHASQLNGEAFQLRLLSDSLSAHTVWPVMCRALLPLAYARVWSFPDVPPVELEYDPTSSTLVFQKPGVAHEFLNAFILNGSTFEGGVEHGVISSVNQHDLSLRLRFVRNPIALDCFREITLEYRAQAEAPPIDSRGILEAIVRTCIFTPPGLRIERIITRTNSVSEMVEFGATRLLVKRVAAPHATDPAPDERSDWDKLAKAIRAAVGEVVRGSRSPLQVEILDLRIDAWSPRSVGL